MRTGYAILLYLCSALMRLPTVSTTFVLKDKFVGNDFYSGWKWETDDDPTHGRVNYVDQGTAVARNLTYGEPPIRASGARCLTLTRLFRQRRTPRLLCAPTIKMW